MNYLNLIGYHGTIEMFADEIISSQKYLVIKRENHWLGNGIYFFENDRRSAEWWATQAKKRNKKITSNTPTILINEIIVLKDEFYDDLSEDSQIEFEEFLDEYSHIIEKLEKKFNDELSLEEKERTIRGHLIHTFCIMRNKKGSRCAFPKSKRVVTRQFKLRDNVGFNTQGIQICVYDDSIINYDTIIKEVVS